LGKSIGQVSKLSSEALKVAQTDTVIRSRSSGSSVGRGQLVVLSTPAAFARLQALHRRAIAQSTGIRAVDKLDPVSARGWYERALAAALGHLVVVDESTRARIGNSLARYCAQVGNYDGLESLLLSIAIDALATAPTSHEPIVGRQRSSQATPIRSGKPRLTSASRVATMQQVLSSQRFPSTLGGGLSASVIALFEEAELYTVSQTAGESLAAQLGVAIPGQSAVQNISGQLAVLAGADADGQSTCQKVVAGAGAVVTLAVLLGKTAVDTAGAAETGNTSGVEQDEEIAENLQPATKELLGPAITLVSSVVCGLVSADSPTNTTTTTSTLPGGTTVTVVATTSGGRTTVVTTSVAPDGSTAVEQVNPDGSISFTQTGSDGTVTKVVAGADGSYGVTVTTADGTTTGEWTDASGNSGTWTQQVGGSYQATQTGTDGTAVYTTFDASTRTTTTTQLTPDGATTTWVDNADGTSITTQVNADGTQTQWTTDASGTVATITAADGSTTSFTFDKNGNQTSGPNTSSADQTSPSPSAPETPAADPGAATGNDSGNGTSTTSGGTDLSSNDPGSDASAQQCIDQSGSTENDGGFIAGDWDDGYGDDSGPIRISFSNGGDPADTGNASRDTGGLNQGTIGFGEGIGDIDKSAGDAKLNASLLTSGVSDPSTEDDSGKSSGGGLRGPAPAAFSAAVPGIPASALLAGQLAGTNGSYKISDTPTISADGSIKTGYTASYAAMKGIGDTASVANIVSAAKATTVVSVLQANAALAQSKVGAAISGKNLGGLASLTVTGVAIGVNLRGG